MRKISKLAIIVTMVSCMSMPAIAQYDINVDSSKQSEPLEILRVYEAGEIYPEGKASTNNTTDAENDVIYQAVKNWNDIITPHTNKDNPTALFYVARSKDENDGCLSFPSRTYNNSGKSDSYLRTALNAVINGKDYEVTSEYKEKDSSGKVYDGAIEMGIAIGTSVDPTAQNSFDTNSYALWNEYNAPLLLILQHEMGHALGISSGVQKFNVPNMGKRYFFSNPGINPKTGAYSKSYVGPISVWDKYLRVDDQALGKTVSPTPGMLVAYSNAQAKEAKALGIETFDIANNSPYFVGPKTMEVLSGLTRKKGESESDFINRATAKIASKGGLVNYSVAYENSTIQRVNGLPIHPFDEKDADPDLSHIELRNSYMSHQQYRNMPTFMEAELAALVDIGYDINLKDYYGKSFYLDNTVAEITNYAPNYNGVTGEYISYKNNAIGTHIYSDLNTITQSANITTYGDGSIGARIDGVANTYTIANNSKIEVNGDNSIGLGVTYGKDHIVNLEENSTIKSTGTNSPAVSFDFGKNIMTEYYETKGSYIYNKQEDESPLLDYTPEAELQGALVDEFNVNGSIISKKSPAIYISENAHVADINIGKGASITGDIVSNWNSVVGGKYARVQKIDPTTGSWTPVSGDDNDKYFTNLNINSDFSYGGNILGYSTYQYTDGLDIRMFEGNTLKLNITAGKALTVDSNVNYEVYNITNNGDLNIASSKALNLSTLNGEVNGSGNINVLDYSTLNLNSDVSQIHNTVNLDNYATLSTINNDTALHTFDNLNFTDKASYLSFDLGDTFDIKDVTNNGLIRVYVNENNAEKIANGELSSADLFTNAIDLDGATSNFYYNNQKYTFSQNSDLKTLDIQNTSEEGQSYDLSNAVSDDTSANYIVSSGEKQINDAGTLDKDKTGFEISGADIDFNNHKGLVVDGTNDVSIKTNLYGAKDSDLTVKNGGDVIIESSDKNIILGKKGESALNITGGSTVTINSKENKIDINGSVTGGTQADTLIINGNTANVSKIDSITVQTNAGNTILNGVSKNVTWDIGDGILNIPNDSYLASNNSLIFNGGNLNLLNNQASTISLNKMALSDKTNLTLDVDLNKQLMDRFAFKNNNDLVVDNNGVISISSINLLYNNAVLNKDKYLISFVSKDLKNTNLLGHISASDSISREIMTPILKYNLAYEENSTSAGIGLNRTTYGGYKDFNPAVLASPIAAQLGGYLMQTQIYEQAFSNMDMTMLMTREERQAMKFANKYASIKNDELFTFSPNQVPEESKGLYFRPFAGFEKVGISGGPRVENNIYGSLFGGESGLIELKRGWDMSWGTYLGYLGSHQNYTGASIYQNGGTLGVNATWYKGNFFTGLTANVGASNAEINTMYGDDNMTMLMTGIASKTGYNWELAKGKFIIQPNWLMSYSFINPFDYTTSAGVAMHSSPINAIQLVPGVKFIGNLPHGWQPYASVQMIWNIIDDTKFSASTVALPEMSIDPYIQYGVGLQKRWGEKFTGFGQVMIRNGGRNGVAFHLGFRWTLGKDSTQKLQKSTTKPLLLEKTKITLGSWKQ